MTEGGPTGAPPIRVAVVAEKCGMAGGSERFVHETASRIAAMPEFTIDIFAHQWEQQDPRIRYHRVPMVRFPKFARPWAFARSAQQRIVEGKFDVVHAHLRNDFAHLTTVHPAPHQFWLSEVIQKRIPSLHDRTMILLERRMIAGAHGRVFHPVSQLLLDTWRGQYPVLPGRWEVVTPGVDTRRFAPDPSVRSQVRRELGIGNDEFVLLFVGMNLELKGLAKVIEGVGWLARQVPSRHVRLVVVGKSRSSRYLRLAARLGIAESVTFAGVANSSRLPGLYSASDAFIILSAFETYCMVVAEAMAAGLPVAITRRMGVRDLVSTVAGSVVLPENPDAHTVATAIDGLARATKVQGHAAQAQSAVRALDWDDVSQRIAAAYRDVAQMRSCARAECPSSKVGQRSENHRP